MSFKFRKEAPEEKMLSFLPIELLQIITAPETTSQEIHIY
jgi:hypothetical protein